MDKEAIELLSSYSGNPGNKPHFFRGASVVFNKYVLSPELASQHLFLLFITQLESLQKSPGLLL
jgi:hypothetical protein